MRKSPRLTPAQKAIYVVPFKKLSQSKAWKLTSKYVRLKSKGVCYTCGTKYPIEKLHCGHFREKTGSAGIYFDLRGLRAQCYRCNRLLHGNYQVFTLKLLKELGEKEYYELNKLAQKSKVWTLKEIEDIAEKMEQELKKWTSPLLK